MNKQKLVQEREQFIKLVNGLDNRVRKEEITRYEADFIIKSITKGSTAKAYLYELNSKIDSFKEKEIHFRYKKQLALSTIIILLFSLVLNIILNPTLTGFFGFEEQKEHTININETYTNNTITEYYFNVIDIGNNTNNLTSLRISGTYYGQFIIKLVSEIDETNYIIFDSKKNALVHFITAYAVRKSKDTIVINNTINQTTPESDIPPEINITEQIINETIYTEINETEAINTTLILELITNFIVPTSTLYHECDETCNINIGPNNLSVVIEVYNNSTFTLDRIFFTQKIKNNPPQQIKDIPDITVNSSINLSEYFFDETKVLFDTPTIYGLNTRIEDTILYFDNAISTNELFIYATDGDNTVTSNTFKVYSQTQISQDILDALAQDSSIRIILKTKTNSVLMTSGKGDKSLRTTGLEDVGIDYSRMIGKKVLVTDENIPIEIKREVGNLKSVIVDSNLLNQLYKMSDIEEIFLDSKYSALTTEVLNMTKIEDAKNAGYSGPGIKVCVLDTGLSPALGYASTGFNFVNNNADYSDVNGHGTTVIYSLMTSAPGIDLIVSKVIDDSGNGYASDIIAGLDYCMQQNASIISMSIGAGSSTGYCDNDLVAQKINELNDAGILVVVATGNDGITDSVKIPSCALGALPVGATTKSSTIASFSNYNNATLLVAPGQDIITKEIYGNDVFVSGTSISVPFVTGTAALLLENESTLTSLELKDLLVHTGDVINYSGRYFTQLNAWNALIRNYTNNFTNQNLIFGYSDSNYTTLSINSCQNLNISNTIYDLDTNVNINEAICFNVTAENITLNCQGYSITGNNAASTYGAYSNQFNTTIKNCVINSFSDSIRYSNATNGLIYNNSLSTIYTGGYGIIITSNSHNNNIIKNSIVTNIGSGVYVNGGQNVSIDCQRESMNSTDGTGAVKYGVYSNQINTTVKNCNINGFRSGIEISGTSAYVSDNNLYYNSGGNLLTASGGYGQFYNNSINMAGNVNLGIASNNNIFENNTIYELATFYIYSGAKNNVINNNNIYSVTSLSTSSNNTYSNNRFNTSANWYGGVISSQTAAAHIENNTFVNNTIHSEYSGGSISVINLMANTTGNNFYLNNISSKYSDIKYVNDASGLNYYNYTIDEKNQGNIYENVIDRNVRIYGITNSSLPDFYIGIIGSGYPYNITTSLGKFSCNFVGCADYAPLTKYIYMAPIINKSNIIPENMSDNITDLRGYCMGLEYDENTLMYYYEWYKNDLLYYSGQTTSNFTSTELSIVDTINSTLTDIGDFWILSCMVSDGINNSTWINSTATEISSGYAPIVESIRINPSLPNASDSISFYCNASDLDSEEIWYNYEISRNDIILYSNRTTYNYTQNNEQNIINITTNYTQTVDIYEFKCWASDEKFNSDWESLIINISNPNNCGNLTEENTVYNLENDIYITNSTCFNVLANNVTINCSGYSITGNNNFGTYGVYIISNNTVVKDCKITGFYNQIYVSAASNLGFYNNILNTTYNSGSAAGIRFQNTQANIQISNNTITGLYGNGMYIFTNSGLGLNYTIANNTVIHTGSNAQTAYIYGLNKSTIIGNTISSAGTSSTAAYIIIYESNLTNNFITSSSYSALQLFGSYSLINNNTCISTGWFPAIYAGSLINNTITNNNFTGNNGLGAQLYSNYAGTIFSNNYFQGNNYAAITFGSSPIYNARFINNTILGVNVPGVYTYQTSGSYNTVFIDNIINSIMDYPININSQSYNITFLGNTMRGDKWIKNNGTQIYFNDSTSGNIYYLNNGDPSWTAFDIYSTNEDNWADIGLDIPYNSTNNPIKWSGIGGDWHPYTQNYHYTPIMISSKIIPELIAYVNDTLMGYCNAIDQDNITISYYYKWYLNGVLNISDTSGPHTQGTQVNLANISQNMLAIGQNWTLECLAYDGITNSTAMNSSITNIQNSLAYTPIVYINSSDVYNSTRSDLICYSNISDINNDLMNVSVDWFKNGVLNLSFDYNYSFSSGTLFNATLDYHNTSYAENWSCALTLYDGIEISPSVYSNNLTITNGCRILSYSNETVSLNDNVSANGTCFIVAANNVTIDCDGYWIVGNDSASSYGIYSTQDYTTVKNCNIRDFNQGIYFSGTDNGTINNNFINITYNYNTFPIYSTAITLFASAKNNLIENNTAYSIYSRAVLWLFLDSDNNTIINNTLYSPSGAGILIEDASENNLLENNSITGVPDISVVGASDCSNIIDNNNGTNNVKFSYYITNASLTNINTPTSIVICNVTDLIMQNITANGISLLNTKNSNFTDINVTGAFILSSDSHKNHITNISVIGNATRALWFAQSDNSTVDGCYAVSQSEYTTLLAGVDNITIKNCMTISDSQNGIELGTYNGSAIYPEYNTLINVTGISTSRYGISLYFASNNTIYNSTGISNSSFGIYIQSSSNNQIYYSEFSSNNNDGIRECCSSNNNYFYSSKNNFNRITTTRSIYYSDAINISSKSNTGWWPALSYNNATTQAGTRYYNGTMGGLNADLSFNESYKYWYNNTQEIPTINIGSINPSPAAYVNDTLLGYCAAIDGDGNNLIYHYAWYLDEALNETGTVGPYSQNLQVNVANITNTSLAVGQNWKLECTADDNSANSSSLNSSVTIIIPRVPEKVTLKSPKNGNVTLHERRPLFEWYSTNVTTYYEITLTSNNCPTVLGTVTYPILNFTPTDELCLKSEGYDTYYNWTARACGIDACGNWSDTWNFTIEPFIDITLTTDGIDFGTLIQGEEKDTSAGNPAPFVLRNDGNVIVDMINISVAQPVWQSVDLGTEYFQAKANISEPGSFNTTVSLMDWFNLTANNDPIIRQLNYSDTNDSAAVDIRIKVPTAEPSGSKSQQILFTWVQTP